MVLGTFYLMLFFTNWCSDVDLAYTVSEVLMWYVFLILLINLLLVLEQLTQPLILHFKRLRARYKRSQSKKETE